MASTIITTGFNAEYPVAGQDNDSQGFRTNFSVTKTGLETARDEITALQDNTAKLNANNDFNGSVISEAEFLKNTETVYAYGNVTASQNISWEFGHYQTIQVGADVTLTLADFPSSAKLGKMRLQITSDGNNRTIIWAAAGGGSFKTDSTWPASFVVSSQTNPIIVDFWTINDGITVFAKYHGVFD
jgi:hypothetical protein